MRHTLMDWGIALLLVAAILLGIWLTAGLGHGG